MKSVGAQELRRVFGPDAVYIFSGKAARDEEKEQLDALHAVKSLDAFDSKMKGKVSLVKAKIKAFYTVLTSLDSLISQMKLPPVIASQPPKSIDWSSDIDTVTSIPYHERTARRLRNHFQRLRIIDRKISKIDAEMGKFENLVQLDVSGNKISALENLPDSLQILNAFSNHISSLGTAPYVISLHHLGVGFNRIYDLSSLLTYHKNLVSLDLSYNNLVDPNMAVAILSQLKHLRQLVLLGNPLSLLQQYRPLICSALPELNTLDAIDVEDFEQIVPFEVMERRKQVLSMWQALAFGEQMDLLKTLNEKSNYRRKADGEMTPKEILQNNAAQLIQHCWMGFQAVKQAKMKRKLMEENAADRRVSLTVHVKSVTLQPPEPVKAPQVEASQEESEKKGKGGKAKKGGKEEKKPSASKKGKGASNEGPWNVKVAVKFPSIKSLSGNCTATSDIFPRAPDVYMDEGDRTIPINLVETVEYPVTVGLRDAIKFEGCEVVVFDVYDFEKDQAQNPGAGPKAPISCEIGNSKINTSRLLDAAAHKDQDGRPKFGLILTVELNRSGTLVSEYCRQQPLYIGEPDLEHGEVPQNEIARIEAEVILNIKTSTSPRAEKEN